MGGGSSRQPVHTTPGQAGRAGCSPGRHGRESRRISRSFPRGCMDHAPGQVTARGLQILSPSPWGTQLCHQPAARAGLLPTAPQHGLGPVPGGGAGPCNPEVTPESGLGKSSLVCSSWWSCRGWSLCSSGWLPLSLPYAGMKGRRLGPPAPAGHGEGQSEVPQQRSREEAGPGCWRRESCQLRHQRLAGEGFGKGKSPENERYAQRARSKTPIPSKLLQASGTPGIPLCFAPQ